MKVAPDQTSLYTVSVSHMSANTKLWIQLEDDEDDKYESIQSILARNTPAARRREFLRLFGSLLVPIGALLIFTSILVSRSVYIVAIVSSGIEAIDNDLLYSQLVSSLQVERGITAMYLSSKGANTDAHKSLQSQRMKVDDMVEVLTDWASEGIVVQGNKLQSTDDFMNLLNSHRWAADLNARTMPVDGNIHFYTNVTHSLMTWLRSVIQLPTRFDAWRYLFHNSMFLLSTDAVGIQRALGSTFATKCILSDDELQWFNLLGAQKAALERLAFDICTECETVYDDLARNVADTMDHVERDMADFNSEQWQNDCSNYGSEIRFNASQIWFSDITQIISGVMLKTRATHNDLTRRSIDAEQVHAKIMMIVFILIILVESISLCGLAVWFTNDLQKLISQMKKFLQLSVQMSKDIESEKSKSEKILLQLLPFQVVEAFKNGLSVEPENYSCVTVLFTDIVNFTSYCASTSPMDVVTLLNDMFSSFDTEIDKRDAFKLETIGDAYTVCSGLPVKNATRHVTEIARLSLDFRTVMTRFRVVNRPEHKVEIRLGIHTGSCCAGVVGIKMPRYCAFGDTLRIANAMESTSKTMKIQMSWETHQLLNEVSDDFDTERREDGVDITGYPSPTFWLNGVVSFSQRLSQLKASQTLADDVTSAGNSVYSLRHSSKV